MECLLISWEPGDCILLPRQLIHIISKAQWTVSANWFEWKILHLTSCLSFVYLTKCEYSVCLKAFIHKVVKFRKKTCAEWLDIALSSGVCAEDHHKTLKGCSSLTWRLCWEVACLTPSREMEDLIQNTMWKFLVCLLKLNEMPFWRTLIFLGTNLGMLLSKEKTSVPCTYSSHFVYLMKSIWSFRCF